MYLHEKNNQFRHYLKGKVEFTEPEINFSKIPEVIEVFDISLMDAIVKDHQKRSNLANNHQRILNYLGDTAGFLPLATLQADIFEKLDKLQRAFPNFAAVIDFYRKEFALTECPDQWWFAANPLLMSGPPGI